VTRFVECLFACLAVYFGHSWRGKRVCRHARTATRSPSLMQHNPLTCPQRSSSRKIQCHARVNKSARVWKFHRMNPRVLTYIRSLRTFETVSLLLYWHFVHHGLNVVYYDRIIKYWVMSYIDLILNVFSSSEGYVWRYPRVTPIIINVINMRYCTPSLSLLIY
jgi:hypothetical protein